MIYVKEVKKYGMFTIHEALDYVDIEERNDDYYVVFKDCKGEYKNIKIELGVYIVNGEGKTIGSYHPQTVN